MRREHRRRGRDLGAADREFRARALDLHAAQPGLADRGLRLRRQDAARLIQNDDLVRPVPSSSFPDVLKQATVAIEDERFYKHKGVDYEGIIRAAVKNATAKGKTVQGGSTLTMQLVRLLYTQDDTRDGIEGYERKIKEAKLARDLEEQYSKKWVVGKYLNTVPYGTVGGQTAIGAEAAVAPVLQQARQGPDAAPGGDARRHAAGAVPVLAGQQRVGHHPAPQRGAGQDGRARLHHA